MKFIEANKLKRGMRLARPIYNKKGVLLFERDSKLSAQTIESVKSFGLLGVYILEPAEPLPPMSEEDLEFERFQISTVFAIQDELEQMLETKRQTRIDSIAAIILKKYGHLNDKINFYQNLRGRDDFVCRHALNTAMLCAMITHAMNVRVDEQLQTVYAALVHDLGKLLVPKEILFAKGDNENRREQIFQSQLNGLEVLEDAFRDGAALRRLCNQVLRLQWDFENEGKITPGVKMSVGAKILLVANRYDEITAMNLQGTSESEVKALYEFREHPELYDEEVVDALLRCINILFPGVSVELNTGDKALIVTENPEDVLRPILLNFKDNTLLDLSLRGNRDIKIVDIMKTLDNRYILRPPSEEEEEPSEGEEANP